MPKTVIFKIGLFVLGHLSSISREYSAVSTHAKQYDNSICPEIAIQKKTNV